MDPQLKKQITAVQTCLGKFVKKPPLAEKHLSRPPFRFLHDIFMAVMNGTGFYQGLFTPGEIDSSTLTTKEEKTQFLHKVISVTALTTGSEVEAKVSKILAGHEPEKTLELLLLLGTALEKGLSSNSAVQKILGVDSITEGKKSEDKKEKTSSAVVTPKSKETVGKSPYQPPTKSTPSTSQKPKSRQNEKEKTSNAKASSSSKAKSPGSKGTKTVSHNEKTGGGEPGTAGRSGEKRERSRSRGDTKAPESKSRDRTLTRVESKEKIPTSKPQAVEESHKPISSKGRHSSKERSTEPAKIVDPIVTKPAESETELPASVDMLSSDAEIFVKNEEDSIQFMGEVESLLQEHGIEIETEKRNKSSDRRKHSASVQKGGEKSLANPQPEKDAVVIDEKLETLDGTDTVLITNHSQPPLRTDSVRIPTAVKSPARPNMGDSDIESDHSDPGPIKNSALEKSSSGPQESATKVGDAHIANNVTQASGNVGRPPSSFTRPSSARPAPPRPKTARIEEEISQYRPPPTKIPVILDSEEVEEENSLDTRKQGLLDLLATTPENLGSVSGELGGMEILDAEGKGHLVQQIMDTKRELEAGDKGREEDEMRLLRKQTQGELEALKGLIQSSARLANPLARLLDFLQEDIDAMTGEYVKYKTEEKKLKELLQKEKEVTREKLKPKRQELMELMDRLEQQNFEIRAAHNDLHAVEEHIQNYMGTIESAPDQVDIPNRFLLKGEWEFDLDSITDELAEIEKKVKPRHGPFGELPAFLCVSIESEEQEKEKGKGFNIPKLKRKVQYGATSFKKDNKRKSQATPSFAIEHDEEEGFGFFSKKGNQKFGSGRSSSQFLEPPETTLDSLEILSEK